MVNGYLVIVLGVASLDRLLQEIEKLGEAAGRMHDPRCDKLRTPNAE